MRVRRAAGGGQCHVKRQASLHGFRCVGLHRTTLLLGTLQQSPTRPALHSSSRPGRPSGPQVCQAGGALRRVDADLLVQLLQLLHALVGPGSKFVRADEQVSCGFSRWGGGGQLVLGRPGDKVGDGCRITI